jgi:hypothetical protein
VDNEVFNVALDKDGNSAMEYVGNMNDLVTARVRRPVTTVPSAPLVISRPKGPRRGFCVSVFASMYFLELC